MTKPFDCLTVIVCSKDKKLKAVKRYGQVVVVANPANTSALILKEVAPSIPAENITALTRLDHNRALALVAEKAFVPVTAVRNAVVWYVIIACYMS